MIAKVNRNVIRQARHVRVRKKLHGTPDTPRMCVYRSAHHIYVQIIDDDAGHTLVSCSSRDKAFAPSVKGLTKKEAAAAVGKEIARRALEKDITQIVFDRGGYLYTGRVKCVADSAREAGLKF